MDRLILIKTFREVAFRRSFSRASVSLGISKATTSKHISELETVCAIRLFNRSTRSLSLTDAGEMLLERSNQLMTIAEETLADLHGQGSHPSGRLRISAPHGLIAGWLSDVIAEYMNLYPDVYVTLVFSNDKFDLVERGIDIHLAGGRIEDMNLIVRRLVNFKMIVCASPAYWARHGIPKNPSDLSKHAILSYSNAPMERNRLTFETKGKPYDVSVHSRMEANDPVALVELALRGVGVACVPEPLAQAHQERGTLVSVLQEHASQDDWLYAAYSNRRHNSAAMRAMLAFLENWAGRRTMHTEDELQYQAAR